MKNEPARDYSRPDGALDFDAMHRDLHEVCEMLSVDPDEAPGRLIRSRIRAVCEELDCILQGCRCAQQVEEHQRK